MNADAVIHFLLALFRAILLANGELRFCRRGTWAFVFAGPMRRPAMRGEKVDETFPAKERLTVNANPTAGAARNRAHQENQ